MPQPSRDTLALALVDGLSAAANAASGILLLAMLSASERGVSMVVVLAGQVGSLVGDAGLPGAAARLLERHRLTPRAIFAAIDNRLSVAILASIALAFPLSHGKGSAWAAAAAAPVFALGFLHSTSCRGVLLAIGRWKDAMAIALYAGIGRLACLAILLLTEDRVTLLTVVGTLACHQIGLVTICRYSRPRPGSSGFSLDWRDWPRDARESCRASWLARLANIAMTRADTILVGLLLSSSALGTYGAAATVAEMPAVVGMALGARFFAISSSLNLKQIRQGAWMSAAFGAGLTLTAAGAARIAFDNGTIDTSYSELPQLLLLLTVASAGYASLGSVTYAAMRVCPASLVRRVVAVATAAALCDLCAIPAFGTRGAAAVASVAYPGVCILLYRTVKRSIRSDFPMHRAVTESFAPRPVAVSRSGPELARNVAPGLAASSSLNEGPRR